ncbi:hypothetical protein OO009_07470 [Flavobacteriaceae bacterium KMM 6897]|nr:hypothetical protein [Flavobacteriaceae bacterium KMM 6897]MEB8345528.1 hypothetical protein [Flavobacteriaceae bacterium KMM 6898]
MIRRLVDYKKLDHQVANLLIEKYPHGYGDSDIISFKNMHGEIVEAVEVKTLDTLYLVKISKCLARFIAEFDDKMEKELEIKPIKPQIIAGEEGENEYEFEDSLEEDFDE